MPNSSVLQEALHVGCSQHGLPGISLVVSSKHSDKEERLVEGNGITPQSVFGIGSITKTCVAVVALQLVREGKLDLDKGNASIYVEDIEQKRLLERIPNAGTATLRQLLSHQSGVPSWEFHPQWIRDARGADMDPAVSWSSTKTLEYLAAEDYDSATLSAPGECYSYSNTNYTILGLIVEAVTRHTIQFELRKRIWEPLGLQSAFLYSESSGNSVFPPHLYHFVTPEFSRDAGIPTAYFDPKPGHRHSLMETTRATNLSCEWAAGGVCMTMADLSNLGRALQKGGVLHDEAMFTYKAPRTDKIGFDGLGEAGDASLQETGEEYCLGLCHSVGPDIWHHGGLTLSFSSRLLLLADGTVIACATNVGLMHSGFVDGKSPWDVYIENVLVPAVRRYLES